MNLDLRSVPKQHTAAAGTDATTPAKGLSPYLLERLYSRLGEPTWYWPTVLMLIFVLFVVGSSVAPDMELVA
jgi:hypothetical protein